VQCQGAIIALLYNYMTKTRPVQLSQSHDTVLVSLAWKKEFVHVSSEYTRARKASACIT
jgi:hypothetical protein